MISIYLRPRDERRFSVGFPEVVFRSQLNEPHDICYVSRNLIVNYSYGLKLPITWMVLISMGTNERAQAASN